MLAAESSGEYAGAPGARSSLGWTGLRNAGPLKGETSRIPIATRTPSRPGSRAVQTLRRPVSRPRVRSPGGAGVNRGESRPMAASDDLLRVKQQRIDELHRLQPGRTALLVIDMQRGFLDEGAALEVPPGRAIIPN